MESSYTVTVAEAESVLKNLIETHPTYPDAYLFLGDLYERQGKSKEARNVYRRALDNLKTSQQDRFQLEMKIRSLR